MTFKEFAEHIRTYESNTFSASGWKITKSEATKVAESFLEVFIDNIDGIGITDSLDEIRES